MAYPLNRFPPYGRLARHLPHSGILRSNDAFWRDDEHLAYGLDSAEFDDDYDALVFLSQELAVWGFLPTVPHTFTHNKRPSEC